MAQQAPRRTGKQGHEIRFDLLRIGLLREPESLRDPTDMGVDDHANIDGEGIAQDDVGRLPGDAWEREQIGHGVRDLAAMLLDEKAHRAVDTLGLVSPEIERLHVRLNIGGGRSRVVRRRRKRFEETGRRLVDPNIGCLGAQNRCHQKFMRGRRV